MKAVICSVLTALILLGTFGASLAANLKDKVSVEVENVGLQPGMDPGMYVCGAGHLHIKGTVQNHAGVPLGRITVAGKALAADGTVLGTAKASTKTAVLAPGKSAEIDLEFLTVRGDVIKRVAKHELTVVSAPAAAR